MRAPKYSYALQAHKIENIDISQIVDKRLLKKESCG